MLVDNTLPIPFEFRRLKEIRLMLEAAHFSDVEVEKEPVFPDYTSDVWVSYTKYKEPAYLPVKDAALFVMHKGLLASNKGFMGSFRAGMKTLQSTGYPECLFLEIRHEGLISFCNHYNIPYCISNANVFPDYAVYI